MPKKDTATAVLGMLSNVGAQTRLSATADPPAAVEAESRPAIVEPEAVTQPPATISTIAPSTPEVKEQESSAPRTIRLRAGTARELRAAWLEAKRDDVLLQSQDFASTLVEEALAARRRRARAASSS
jgi:hypothetical protein